tara:strand:- start:373 stop:996 length:624 start_codon:yes stop_codon:yes gene_type:complete
MKNITINLIGQSVLEEVLRENLKHINFEIKSFKKFNEIIQDSKVKNSSILVTSLKDYDLFINSKLNIPVLFLNFGSKKSYTTSAEIINCPFQLNNFVERINVIFLKNKFLNNSNINILNYEINLNSKEILRDGQKLKLTEREINFILFLKNSNSPQNIKSILKSVWNYSSNLETHTVETHVHRLRKKFFSHFKDDNFIKINKKGYFI